MDSVKIFKALSDETRIKIVKHLFQHDETSCQDLLKKFALSQPTLSHHFGKLTDAGIIQMRKEGVLHYYRLDKKYLMKNGIDIEKMFERR